MARSPGQPGRARATGARRPRRPGRVPRQPGCVVRGDRGACRGTEGLDETTRNSVPRHCRRSRHRPPEDVCGDAGEAGGASARRWSERCSGLSVPRHTPRFLARRVTRTGRTHPLYLGPQLLGTHPGYLAPQRLVTQRQEPSARRWGHRSRGLLQGRQGESRHARGGWGASPSHRNKVVGPSSFGSAGRPRF